MPAATLGTISSGPEVLETTVAALAGHEVSVIATVGSSLRDPTEGNPAAGKDNGSVRPSARPDGVDVRYVPFGQLLDRADLVVGAGTVRGRADEINSAVRRVLEEDTFRDQAKAAAAEHDARLSPADVIKEITEIGLGMTGLGATAGQARGGSE